ncbi:hypothetical protein PPERSA_00497 [Pseudocohnilembus persalinus]|uniref:Transmembrane protein n=1 Tax=Pseudocohnilembus persalinus TaxID=266149 RepID=A0A0V0R8B6_PSEPJ|nr:hypothetical protein PPERSA_00497 [Pseudocohnilembus persalinus]|eukprot:KRX10727.1 hypothetical protein PPERSA_00497 [Pseudocohnilembus persalinus]
MDRSILDSKFFCQFQGFLNTYGFLCSLTFGIIISLIVYVTVVKNFQEIKNYDKYVSVFGPLAFRQINAGVYYCQIVSDDSSLQYNHIQLYYFFIPLWLGIIVILINNISVVCYIKNMDYNEDDKKLVYQILYFPLILIFCGFMFSFGFIFQNYAKSFEHQTFLYCLAQVFYRLQGLLNSFIYGNLPNVMSIIRQKICPQSKQKQEKLQNSKISQISHNSDYKLYKEIEEEDLYQNQAV